MDCNEIKYLALAELGYTKQPNFNANGDRAVNLINTEYEHLYNLALTSYDWCFCSAFSALNGEDTDNRRYAYKFELPEDLLFLRGTYADDCGTLCRDFYNGGKRVYANCNPLYIRYTRQVCEQTLPPYFVEYLKYKLAANLCQTLTGDQNLLQQLIAREEQAFNVAKNADINQRPPVFLPMGVFTEVRY